jgi:hypothetical protein
VSRLSEEVSQPGRFSVPRGPEIGSPQSNPKKMKTINRNQPPGRSSLAPQVALSYDSNPATARLVQSVVRDSICKSSIQKGRVYFANSPKKIEEPSSRLPHRQRDKNENDKSVAVLLKRKTWQIEV